MRLKIPPEIQWLVCSNLRISYLVSYMIWGGRGGKEKNKKKTFLSESFQNILFFCWKRKSHYKCLGKNVSENSEETVNSSLNSIHLITANKIIFPSALFQLFAQWTHAEYFFLLQAFPIFPSVWVFMNTLPENLDFSQKKKATILKFCFFCRKLHYLLLNNFVTISGKTYSYEH